MVDRRDLELEPQGRKGARLLSAREPAMHALEVPDRGLVVRAVGGGATVDDDEGVDEGAEALEPRRGRREGVVGVEEKGVGGRLQADEFERVSVRRRACCT